MKTKILLLLSLFSIAMSMEIKAAEAYAVLNGSTLTFYYDADKAKRAGTVYELNRLSFEPKWYSNADKISTVVFNSSFSEARPTTTHYWFKNMTKLTSIVGMRYLNTSKVTRMSHMFQNCSSLTSLDLSSFDTSNVTDIFYMFWGCSSLTSLDLSSFDTTNVTLMDGMFAGCSNLTYLNLSSFNTPKVIDMGYMFWRCASLTSLNLSTFDTSNVTDIGSMFRDCSSLTSLNLSRFTTSKVTDMSYLFDHCSSLTNLDLSSFDTSNVTKMNFMFDCCSSLTSLDLSSFNTSNVTDMYSMFRSCYSLISLELSNFDTSNVTNMNFMFDCCSSLTSLDLSSFNTSNVTEMSSILYGCSSLTNLNISSTMENMNDNSCENVGTTSSPCTIYAPEGFDFGVDTSGDYFQWKGGYFKLGKEEAPKETYAVLTDDEYSGGKRLSFYYDSEKSSHDEGTVYSLNEGANFPDWNTEETAASITSVGYHCDFEDARPTSGYCWFYEMGNLERIDDGQFLNTSEMTNMAGMFFYCSKLSYIGAYNFDTSKATNMWAMFYGCSALEELDVSGFNTSNVTDMTGMFCYCSSLTSLDLSSFDTSKSTSFNGMFYGCSGLTSLNLGGFDISSATDTQNMLAYCTGLKELTVSLSMQDLADGACAGIGTASSPCTIYAPAGFNFGVSTTGSYFQWKGGYFKLGAQTALLGDVNASGTVTLADAICEISWLLEQNPPVFVEAVADYNQDNVVSASDAIAIIQYVATVEPSPINPDVPDPDVTKILDELGLLRPTLNGFDLPLADLRGYTAFTMDVTLPDGETLASAKLGTHSVAVTPLGGNRYRIVAWSMDMAEIGSGTTLHCTTTGGSPASAIINNIRIVDLQTREHGARAVECTPDGIHYMDKAPDTSSPRYRIDGTRIATPHRGIVIENGRKVVVRQ